MLVKVLAPAFFAREDTRTPLVATLSGILIAVVCGLFLGRAHGASGVAASISLGAWASAAFLAWRGAATFGFAIDAAARKRLPRIAICAAVMGTMLFIAEAFVAPVTASAGFAANLTILGGLVAAGISFYGLLLDLSGVVNWGEAIGNLRDGRLRE